MGGWVQYRVILTGGVNMSGWGGCIEHHTGWIYPVKEARGVVVSHPLSMREALGSILSVSNLFRRRGAFTRHRASILAVRFLSVACRPACLGSRMFATHSLIGLRPACNCFISFLPCRTNVD